MSRRPCRLRGGMAVRPALPRAPAGARPLRGQRHCQPSRPRSEPCPSSRAAAAAARAGAQAPLFLAGTAGSLGGACGGACFHVSTSRVRGQCLFLSVCYLGQRSPQRRGPAGGDRSLRGTSARQNGGKGKGQMALALQHGWPCLGWRSLTYREAQTRPLLRRPGHCSPRALGAWARGGARPPLDSPWSLPLTKASHSRNHCMLMQ